LQAIVTTSVPSLTRMKVAQAREKKKKTQKKPGRFKKKSIGNGSPGEGETRKKRGREKKTATTREI